MVETLYLSYIISKMKVKGHSGAGETNELVFSRIFCITFQELDAGSQLTKNIGSQALPQV